MNPIIVLGLAEQILRVIANHQEIILAADPDVRDKFLARLDKWESFWERIAEPLYKLITKDADA